MRTLVAFTLLLVGLQSCGGGSSSSSQGPENGASSSSSSSSGGTPAIATLEKLGEALYNDVNLSKNRTQSCATCHDPETGFIDTRTGNDGKVFTTSLGDDDLSFGDRNTPTAAYAMLTPEFQILDSNNSRQRFNSDQPNYQGPFGGQFLDGRATNLVEQAEGPPVNPVEMGMEDKAAVVARIQENSDYEASFTYLYGDDVFDDIDLAYTKMAEAIAAFEKTPLFAPFTSKYDKALDGDYIYDPLSKAAAGKSLFFSQEFTSCATCHQLRPNGHDSETFTGFEYHNIGIPANTQDRIAKAQDPDFIDDGLLANSRIENLNHKGKFKVPTLRNVAITAPYMHNGVFEELATVLQFYDHFIEGSTHTINPETGETWADPEVPETVAETELANGQSLDDEQLVQLECFLRTLTDERYEDLLPNDGKCE